MVKKGIKPIKDAYFDGRNGKQYAFLTLADIDGFIYDGCATIEQSHGIDDTNPTRGTIDQDRFELYVKEKVIPFVGRYDKCEPWSILIIDNATTVFAMKICEIINAFKQYLVTSAALNKAIIRRNGVPKFYSSIKFTSTTL